MNSQAQRAIFMTNAFASEHPQEHTNLWYQFESETPHKERTGYYGADNVAYIKWLRDKRVPLFTQFLESNIGAQAVEN